jgi:hypothetical protein
MPGRYAPVKSAAFVTVRPDGVLGDNNDQHRV